MDGSKVEFSLGLVEEQYVCGTGSFNVCPTNCLCPKWSLPTSLTRIPRPISNWLIGGTDALRRLIQSVGITRQLGPSTIIGTKACASSIEGQTTLIYSFYHRGMEKPFQTIYSRLNTIEFTVFMVSGTES